MLCTAAFPHPLVSTESVLLGIYASVLARNIFFLSPLFFLSGAAHISLTVSLSVLNCLEGAKSIQEVLCRLHTNATLFWITELSIHEFGIQGNLCVD